MNEILVGNDEGNNRIEEQYSSYRHRIWEPNEESHEDDQDQIEEEPQRFYIFDDYLMQVYCIFALAE